MFINTTLARALPWLLLVSSRLAHAACECGYSVNKTSDVNYAVFTELQENDFLHTTQEGTKLAQVGWAPQVYNTTSGPQVPYGRNMELRNVVANPLKDSAAWSGASKHGGDAGLQLWVRADHQDNLVDSAEIVSRRNDALLGSFRVGLKLANVSGTCGAFFWFHNNASEIDMEFLSRQFNNSQGSINLVIHTAQSAAQGFDATGTPDFSIQALPYRPDAMFHEYRFDWTASRVAFYVDGTYVYEMSYDVPTEPGSMFFNHWSNGGTWTMGPPRQDAVMTIAYMKAYFNSSDPARYATAYKKRCPTFDPSKVCLIPSQKTPPDASLGPNAPQTYFFSNQNDMTPGQTTYHSDAMSCSANRISMVVSLLVTLLVLTLS